MAPSLFWYCLFQVRHLLLAKAPSPAVCGQVPEIAGAEKIIEYLRKKMSPTVEINGKIAKVILAGQFDFNSHREFRQACESVIGNANVSEVQIDFQKVTYLDSSALGMLLLVKEKVNAVNKSLALVNCKDSVRQVLEIACFGKIFSIR